MNELYIEAFNGSRTVEVGLTSSGYLYLLESSIDLIIGSRSLQLVAVFSV